MFQRKIWLAFLLVLAVGVTVSVRIVLLGDSVQVVNHSFITEKLPLSQRLGELHGIIATEERLLYEYYSYTATREDFLTQRARNKIKLSEIVEKLEKDSNSHAEIAQLRTSLGELWQLSDKLSLTLADTDVDWDKARDILKQTKPKVRQIEMTLGVISAANQQAVNNLGVASKNNVSTMVWWVIGFAVLIFIVALIIGYYVVEIIRARELLKRQAYYDEASGLPNRYKLYEVLGKTVPRQHEGSVLMIVADREQEILENFGAAETEKWLIRIAQRLGEELPEKGETLYRFGDNAFVLIRASGNLSDASARATQLLSAARQPLLLDSLELFSTLSIGAMQYDSGVTAETLIQRAASACIRVHRAGGNDFAIYDEVMSIAAAKTLRLAADLHHAVENNELRLHYQPKVDAATGRLLGMEALVRWIHPERGLVSPFEFIPVAEDTGLIVGIGRWVLFEACRQNAQWQQSGLRPLRVAVNLSARQFRTSSLLSEIDAALAESGLPVSSLELEVTESMVMDDPESVIRLLGEIHDRGIHLSLDDFGTGHSSLAYLKRFPIDCVKVDRAFIKDTPENTDDVAIARTIVAMAKALGLSTVAEGVETAEQRALMVELECDQIQGYYFSRPLPADEFLTYYRDQL